MKTADDVKAARKKLRERIKDIQGALFESSYYDSVFLRMLEDAVSQLLSVTGASKKVLADAN